MKKKLLYYIGGAALILGLIGCIILFGSDSCISKDTVMIKMITFNGSEVLEKEVEVNQKISSLPVPERSGYAFGGWYYDSEFEKKVSYPFSVNTDTVLIAAWYNYLTYELDDATDTYTVTGVNYAAFDIEIPATYLNKKVTKIASYAFDTLYYLKTLKLPDTIITIEDYAFNNCVNLTEINLPDSIQNIGLDIFNNCGKLSYENERGLKYINNWLVDGTFAEMSSGTLKEDTVGIFPGAFNGNETLNELTIPCKVKNIYSDTFKNSSITKVIIGENVEFIDVTAFSNTASLKEIEVVENNKFFRAIDNVLFNKDVTELILYPTEKDNLIYTVPSTVSIIRDRACMFNKYITKINLSENLIEIGKQSFFQLTNLIEVTFNNKLEVIKDEAFRLSSKVESLLLPATVREIGKDAFKNLYFVEEMSIPYLVNNDSTYKLVDLFGGEIPSTLKTLTILGGTAINVDSLQGINSVENIYIGASISHIDEGAFFDGENITKITIDENNNHYKSVSNIIFTKDNKTLLYYAPLNTSSEYSVPGSVITIAKHAFKDNKFIKFINLNNGLKEIHSNAFHNLPNLTQLIIPSSVLYTEQDICYVTSNVTIYIYSGVVLDNWSEGWNTLVYPVVWNAIFPTFNVIEREFHIDVNGTYELSYTISDAPDEYNVIITVSNEEVAKVENNVITGLSDGMTEIHLLVEGYPTSDFVIIVHVGIGE